MSAESHIGTCYHLCDVMSAAINTMVALGRRGSRLLGLHGWPGSGSLRVLPARPFQIFGHLACFLYMLSAMATPASSGEYFGGRLLTPFCILRRGLGNHNVISMSMDNGHIHGSTCFAAYACATGVFAATCGRGERNSATKILMCCSRLCSWRWRPHLHELCSRNLVVWRHACKS